MEYEQLIRERYSLRKFADTPIEEEKLAAVLEAGKAAPTGVNAQPQRVYVLKSPEAIAKIRQITKYAFDAPAVLLFAYDRDAEWKNPLEEGIAVGIQDTCIVATHMMLEATNVGLGTCWVCFFPNSVVKEAFHLPENEVPALLMPIGYPAEGAHPSRKHADRKDVSEWVKEI